MPEGNPAGYADMGGGGGGGRPFYDVPTIPNRMPSFGGSANPFQPPLQPPSPTAAQYQMPFGQQGYFGPQQQQQGFGPMPLPMPPPAAPPPAAAPPAAGAPPPDMGMVPPPAAAPPVPAGPANPLAPVAPAAPPAPPAPPPVPWLKDDVNGLYGGTGGGGLAYHYLNR